MLFGVYDEEMEKQVIREEERAKAEARVEARVEARIAKERARTTIDTLLDVGYSNEEILFILQKKLGIKEQQADEYLRKFYDKTL